MAKTFKRMSGTLLASAALAIAGLLAPASAHAQVWYSPGCIAYFTNYCAANWQALGFASSAQCVEHYKETACKGYITYPDDYLVPPTVGHID
jgi:hypothetical protein